MQETSVMSQLEALETENCVPVPKELPLNPVLEHLKQSTFQPDIHSYITLDAKVFENKTYWLEMHAKYFDTEMEIWLHDTHASLDEATKYLRSLNRLTGDMLDFIGKHNLRSPIKDAD
jgi:hypothetical protein